MRPPFFDCAPALIWLHSILAVYLHVSDLSSLSPCTQGREGRGEGDKLPQNLSLTPDPSPLITGRGEHKRPRFGGMVMRLVAGIACVLALLFLPILEAQEKKDT